MKSIKTQKILVLIVMLFSLGSCQITTEPEEIIEYIPGQVIVGLVDTVSYQFAVDFCKAEDLEILKLEVGNNFWAVADSNNLEYYQNLFSNDSTVIFIDKLLTSSSNDTLLITISFSGVNNLEHDIETLNLVGLAVYKTNKHSGYILVKTPINLEQFYIEKLIKYNFVQYAELNYISSL